MFPHTNADSRLSPFSDTQTFRHALSTQCACDGVLELAKTKQWMDVKIA